MNRESRYEMITNFGFMFLLFSGIFAHTLREMILCLAVLGSCIIIGIGGYFRLKDKWKVEKPTEDDEG